MRRVLCVLFVVTLGNAAVRYPRGYGTDSSVYLQHNEKFKLGNTPEELQISQGYFEEFKNKIPADGGIKGRGLTNSQTEAVNNLCSITNNGEDKADHVTNKKIDSNMETDDKQKLDVRYMKMTDDSSRNGCKKSNKQVNSASKTDNDLTTYKTETTSTNSDTAPFGIGLSGSSYITDKSSIDDNSRDTAYSAPNIGKTENGSSKIKKPSYSSSLSIIEHNSDDISSSNNFKIERTLTDSDTKHFLTVGSPSDISFDKQSNTDKSSSNNRYESLVITTITNTPFISEIDVKEEFKSSNFNTNANKDQSNTESLSSSSNNSLYENGKVTTGLPPFVIGSGIDVKHEFKSNYFSSNTNNEHSNKKSVSNGYINFQTDTKSTNLDKNVAVATGLPVISSKDEQKSTKSPTSSVSLTESTSNTTNVGGSKHDTKETTILIKSDSISHVNTSDSKISDSSFDHSKSTMESINHQNNYSAVSSHTNGDSVSIVKPIPSYQEIIKIEHVSGDNHKDTIHTGKNKENTIHTDKNKENASTILIIVDHNKHKGFEGNKGGHEVHHYNGGHRCSHESDSTDSSSESDESWEKDHHRHHQHDGHHNSHESDSSSNSSDESDESGEEGHKFRFYGHKYDDNDAAEILGESWVG